MRGSLTAILGVAFACVAASAFAGAETSGGGLRSLMTADDSRGWEAVGRIDIGETGFCTGALIAPDVVLTAAHCLFDPYTKEAVPVSEMTFLAGWRNGRANAYRGVRHAVAHPDYEYKGHDGESDTSLDIALLKLDQPIRKASVTPFSTAKRPRKGATVGVVSYARNRETRPAIQEDCHVLGRPGGTLVMSCDVDFGSSGAPVFSFEEDGAYIVSVISAKAEVDGRPVSLGTRLSDSLAVLEAALDAAETGFGGLTARAEAPGIRTIGPKRIGESDGGGGAKFLRP